MLVTINKPANTIDISEVTEDMYFVGTENRKAVGILNRDRFREGAYEFLALGDFTQKNGWPQYRHNDVKSSISEWMLSQSDREVHAFHTPKEAFQFIADNL